MMERQDAGAVEEGEFSIRGRFEADGNILHLWFSAPIALTTAVEVEQFFHHAERKWLDVTPSPFYLLVNFTNLTIDPGVTDAYTQALKAFQHKLLGTYRYRVTEGLTATVVRLANMRLAKASQIYQSEADARAAIKRAR